MKPLQIIVTVLVSALVAVGISLALVPSVASKVQSALGVAAGPEKTEFQSFLSSFQSGGRYATSTDDTSATALASNFKDITRYDFTPNVTGITLTLPATSTLSSFVPKAGDTRSIFLCNATTTAATPFTLAVGTGMNLVQATSTLAINTNYCATLTFSRQADSDIDVFYNLGY